MTILKPGQIKTLAGVLLGIIAGSFQLGRFERGFQIASLESQIASLESQINTLNSHLQQVSGNEDSLDSRLIELSKDYEFMAAYNRYLLAKHEKEIASQSESTTQVHLLNTIEQVDLAILKNSDLCRGFINLYNGTQWPLPPEIKAYVHKLEPVEPLFNCN